MELRELGYKNKIISFEPQKKEYEILKANSKNDPKKENENQNNSKTKINFAKTVNQNINKLSGKEQLDAIDKLQKDLLKALSSF